MPVQLITFALFVLLMPVCAQDGTQERAASLRAQLADVQAQQTELQVRLAQIDEDIKPDNIERSLAGVGSTHPEDLREARRRQLDVERRGIQRQLEALASSRARLEAAIAAADADVYRRTVGPSANSAPNYQTPNTNRGRRQRHRVRKRRSPRRNI